MIELTCLDANQSVFINNQSVEIVKGDWVCFLNFTHQEMCNATRAACSYFGDSISYLKKDFLIVAQVIFFGTVAFLLLYATIHAGKDAYSYLDRTFLHPGKIKKNE